MNCILAYASSKELNSFSQVIQLQEINAEEGCIRFPPWDNPSFSFPEQHIAIPIP
jgi:hypothetical protein